MYISKSAEPFDEVDLAAILRISHQKNLEKGITGVLLYVRGSIIQVLEGEKEAVDYLYNQIEQDHRHIEVSLVMNRPISKRLFGEWGMGYETITDRQFEEISAIVKLDEANGTSVKADDHIILKTIQLFYESNRYN